MDQIRVFDRDYTVDQLDRAEGMHFHPCDNMGGLDMTDREHTHYDEESHTFYQIGGGWGTLTFTRPRISDGTTKKKGDPYPAHWTFDPFTGELLQRHFSRAFTADDLDRGKGLQFHPCHPSAASQFLWALTSSCGFEWFEKTRQFICKGSPPYDAMTLPRISTGADVKAGDPYPSHWLYCPFTGGSLK